MAYEIVQCEVRWIASYGISSTGSWDTRWEILGEFETEGDAARAMAEKGLTLKNDGWYAPYTFGYITRSLREISMNKSQLRFHNDGLRSK